MLSQLKVETDAETESIRYPVTPDTQRYLDECNRVKHKLKLLYHFSGDDHDSWVVKCTKCKETLIYVTDIADPDLNYCMNCITQEELNRVVSDLDCVRHHHYIMAHGRAEDTPPYD